MAEISQMLEVPRDIDGVTMDVQLAVAHLAGIGEQLKLLIDGDQIRALPEFEEISQARVSAEMLLAWLRASGYPTPEGDYENDPVGFLILASDCIQEYAWCSSSLVKIGLEAKKVH